jgi:hypothetical protein
MREDPEVWMTVVVVDAALSVGPCLTVGTAPLTSPFIIIRSKIEI